MQFGRSKASMRATVDVVAFWIYGPKLCFQVFGLGFDFIFCSFDLNGCVGLTATFRTHLFD